MNPIKRNDTIHGVCTQPREESRIDNNRNKIQKDNEKKKKANDMNVCVYIGEIFYTSYIDQYTLTHVPTI